MDVTAITIPVVPIKQCLGEDLEGRRRREGGGFQGRLRSGLEIKALTGVIVTEGGAEEAAFQAISQQRDAGLPGANAASPPAAATASQREESEKSCPAAPRF